MTSTREETAFLTDRGFPSTASVHWPKDIGESLNVLRNLAAQGVSPSRIAVVGRGGAPGQRDEADQVEQIVRTPACSRLLGLDRVSGLARVESGMTWERLWNVCQEEGFEPCRYGLTPSRATLGGLLATPSLSPTQRHIHTLRQGVIALSAMTFGAHHYTYIAAPRKASGPDLRALFIGARDHHGMVLDVTVKVWPRDGAVVWQIETESAVGALRTWRDLSTELGPRLSWTHWSSHDRLLSLCLYGPDDLLDAYTQGAISLLGSSLSTRDAAQARELRREIEAAHPARRTDHTTLTLPWMPLCVSMRDAEDVLQRLDASFEGEVVLHDFNPHFLTLFVHAQEEEKGALDLFPDLTEQGRGHDVFSWRATLRDSLSPGASSPESRDSSSPLT